MRATYCEHAGHAYVTSGDILRGRALYTEAFELARENYLYFRSESAANSLCGLALADGNVPEARKWCEICKEQTRQSKREAPDEEAMSYEAEVCIREGSFAQARALISMIQPHAKRLNSSRAHARELALQGHLKLARGESLSQRECQQMLLHYPKVSRAFRMDYFVAQLVRGLASLHRTSEAVQVFWQYVSCDRVSHAPLSIDLVEIQKLELHRWSSAAAEAIDDRVDSTLHKKKPRA